MLYKYEMHVHDSLCSRCGHNPPEVIALFSVNIYIIYQ